MTLRSSIHHRNPCLPHQGPVLKKHPETCHGELVHFLSTILGYCWLMVQKSGEKTSWGKGTENLIVYRDENTSQVVVEDFFHQQYHLKLPHFEFLTLCACWRFRTLQNLASITRCKQSVLSKRPKPPYWTLDVLLSFPPICKIVVPLEK